MNDQTQMQTVKQAALTQPKRKHPTAAAGGGSLAMIAATYLGHRWGWDPELIAMAASVIGILMTLAVHYLHSNFPVLVNAIEEATGRDLNRDGQVGKGK